METRRDFLKKMAATVAAMGLDPFAAVTVADDTYRNSRLGLSLRKPAGWEYSSFADFAALREKTVIEGFDDEARKSLTEMNLPLLLAEDPAHRDGYFAPSLGMYDEALIGTPPKDELRAHRRFLANDLSYYHQKVRIRKMPAWIDLHGARGTISTSSYTHATTDGFSYDLLLRTIIVRRNDRVHTFYFTDSLAAPKIPDEIWNDAIASISYAAS